ncbi:MAG TPA: hypothetical protein VGL56_17965 [Fimbriimonadaceae bacterium]
MSRSQIVSALFVAFLAVPISAQGPRDLFSDTWVASDALGRNLPTNHEVGPRKKNRTVGIFYFINFAGGGSGPYDNAAILGADPGALNNVKDPAWGTETKSHYWGEPLFGYYSSDDEYVLRKHAELLSDAGVDLVIFDNSNGYTFDAAREKLMQVWENIRKEGGSTPQISFLCPFSNYRNIGTSTVKKLYDDVYKPGKYDDLLFRWKGKPLLLADPAFFNLNGGEAWTPSALNPGHTLGQTFGVLRPFNKIGGVFPTWEKSGSAMTLSLYEGGPTGAILASKKFENVENNSQVLLDTGTALPPGRYYLEMSDPIGTVGWWGYSKKIYHDGEAYVDNNVQYISRSLDIHYADSGPNQIVSLFEPEDQEAGDISKAFTFRKPEPLYNVQHPSNSSWGWLQIYPQAPFLDDFGKPEEITVGVAQNYNITDRSTAPMSHPGALGRSYHATKVEDHSNAVDWGYNFSEQWNRALKVDPPFVFVTGWNEWTASIFDKWGLYTSPPVVFVDEFNEEYSRDIEPMLGGHEDDYYYQLVSNIRKYKGARQIDPVKRITIPMSSNFDGWNKASPEYKHWIGSEAVRSSPGVGKTGVYTNLTGRNNIISARVAYDSDNVYFFAQTSKPISPSTDPNWMLLFLKTDKDANGWLGYNIVINRHPSASTTSLESSASASYQWDPVANVTYSVAGDKLQISVPRSILGIKDRSATIDFKWADNCFSKGDWTDFYLNGDAAPDGRFNYRALIDK